MSGPKKPNAYDAFSTVDSLVSKPVLGSDGAADWQNFQKNNKAKGTASRGVAPHMPLKKADKLSGLKSIQEERKHETSVRQEAGDRDMGSGYTVFKKKHTLEEAAERKRRKMIMERRKPDDVDYFIRSDTFAGYKFDYIFTTRDGRTGYYWDGLDSIKKLDSNSSVGDNDAGSESQSKSLSDKGRENESASQGTNEEPPKKKIKKDKDKKKKKKKKSDDKVEDQEVNTTTQTTKDKWQSAVDPMSGRVYYFNVELNETRWEHPSSENLPQGWEIAKDPSTGKDYFFNRKLNKTSWGRPTE